MVLIALVLPRLEGMCFFFQAEDGIRDRNVTGVQTCALPISPAAMRYTEAKLSHISSELLRDIEKETVDFISNFDDTNTEPVVFPAKFPNLLVNGSTGISAGYATDIPPHNLSEVIDAIIQKRDNPDITNDE